MESEKVISRKILPIRSPISATVTYVLAMDYWSAPEWLWGVGVLILVLIWATWIVSFFKQEQIDVIND